MPSGYSGYGSNRDPLKDFVIDLFSSPPEKPKQAREKIPDEKFSFWSPYPVLASAGAWYLPPLLGQLGDDGLPAPLHSGIDTAAQFLTDAALPSTVLAAAVLGVDFYRRKAFRQRRVFRGIVHNSTSRPPESLSVIPGWRSPRRGRAKMPDGTVIDEDRLKRVTAAVQAAFGDKTDVTWHADRDMLKISRNTKLDAADDRSERHKRITEALDKSSPLAGATVSVHETDPDTGEETRYRISYSPALRAAAKGFQASVSEALIGLAGESVGGRRWAVDWQPSQDYVDLYAQEALPTRVLHPVISDYRDYLGIDRPVVPYATGAAGKHGFWDVSMKSNAPHFLASGPTGGGKTSLIRTCVIGGSRIGIPWLCADPKQIELIGLEGWPGVEYIAYEIVDMVLMLQALHDEMMARYRLIRVERINITEELSPIGIVLDEFLIMSKQIQRLAKSGDDQTRDLIKSVDPLGIVEQILALGRSAWFRVLTGVQRPDAGVFGSGATSVRDNFRTRASLSRLSQQGALMMWDDAEAGTDLDQSVPGQATISDHAGEPMTAQVWWTPDVDSHPKKWAQLSAEDRALVTALRPTKAPELTAVSDSLQNFLRERRSTTVAASSAPSSTAAELAKVDDAVRAELITPGMTIQADMPDGSSVTGLVTHARRAKGSIVLSLDTEGRARDELVCEPGELLFVIS